MNPKKLITAVLLVFVAGSLGYMFVRDKSAQSASTSAPQAVMPETGQSEPNQQVIVYYFYGDVRCPTCHKLEEYAKESLDTHFANDLAAGKIQWKPTNVDTAGNEHFVKDYELVTKSVVLSKIVDGRQVGWKNLDQIWQLVSDKDKYLAYIRENISAFVKKE
ncbi:MAG: hypothetical protein JW749_09345 [Sedimentisphaerales bacterium]|nr:hypothetical protein [Sedimentisphaerales bacterium]